LISLFPYFILFHAVYYLNFFCIYLIGYELNNPSNETESMLKCNTNFIIPDGSLHEMDTVENNTCFGKITLK